MNPNLGLRIHPDHQNCWSGEFGGVESSRTHPDRNAGTGFIPESSGIHPDYFDVGPLLDGTYDPPTPTVCLRTDGVGLFYLGQLNTVFGDPEDGKTLLADHATVEVLDDDGRVLRLDLDHNGPHSTIHRLLAMGASPDALRDRDRFLYVEPDGHRHMAAIVAHMREWEPTLVVLDSLGELLPMFGTNSNNADEFTTCHTRVLKPLVQTGAAVVAVDHLSKGTDSRSQGPIGTVAKRRVLGGSSIRVKADVQFVPGKGGSAYLSLNKDRHGGLRQHCPTGDREPLIGKFVLTPNGDGMTGEIKAANSTERNPQELAPADDIAAVAALKPPPKTAKDTQQRLHWRDARARSAFKAWRAAASV